MSLNMGYNRVVIDNKESGNWIQNTFNDNNCKILEVVNKYPIMRIAINSETNLIAMADKFGSVYLMDTNRRQFRRCLRLNSKISTLCVTSLAFVDNNTAEEEDVECNLIVSTTHRNAIHLIKYCPESLSSRVLATIESMHKTSINCISFSAHLMMTSSKYDTSLVWDLKSLRALKQSVDPKCSQSQFWSFDRIIQCYRKPNTIHVLDSVTYQVLQTFSESQLISVQNQNFITRSDDLSLELHFLDNENRLQTNSISEEYLQLNSIQIKETICGFERKLLVYLTIDGLLKCKHFLFDINIRFSTIISNDNLLVGLTANGEINVFDLNQLNDIRLKKKKIIKEEVEEEEREREERKRVQKLSLILLEKHQKFPQKYRFFIWSKLLGIPQNSDSFKRIQNESKNMSSEVMTALRHLSEGNELIDKSLYHSLHTTIAQLLYWRPEELLDSLEDLALFCFPFVKLFFRKNQLICFEIIATLLDNNYFLFFQDSTDQQMFALIADLLRRECPQLDQHFNALLVKSKDLCFRPLIQSIFSEVFLRNDWLTICDQLVSFGPQIYIYLIVSFCCQSKQVLIRIKNSEQIHSYFRSQNSMPANKVIELSHKLSQKYVQLMPYQFTPLTKNIYN